MSRRSDHVGKTIEKPLSTGSLDTAISAVAERLVTDKSRVRDALNKVITANLNHIYSIEVGVAERRGAEGTRVKMTIVFENINRAAKAPQERLEFESNRAGQTPQVALL
ncbi:hypothetical protein KBB08_02110 [Candidatus Gracilibacteria bacterium]|nr:hypothetical protein [Candidatus Gracilibacteria bacterium]